MFRLAIAVTLLTTPALAQERHELKTEGGTVTLTIDKDGMPMVDFVKWVQQVSGRAFTFDSKALATADPVQLIGTLRFDKDDFEREFQQFFQTQLFVKGFALQTDEDAQITKIVAMPKRPAAVRYVAVDDLAEHKTGTAPILTSIRLENVPAKTAIERVNNVLAATATAVALQSIDRSLLVQGAGADVYCAWRMIRLLDTAPPKAVKVVALRHATAANLVVGLRQLAADHPAVVVAHGDSNALLISGPPTVVAELKDIATLLDRPADKSR